MEHKVCTSCNKETPLALMGKDKGSKDGYNIYCKSCVKTRSQKTRDLDPEQNRIWQFAYAQKNRKSKSEKDLKRYYFKKEEILIKNAEYRKTNHERRLEIERASRAKNINKIRYSKILSQAKRKKRLSECKVYDISDKDLNRLYSDKCYNCDSTENQSIDHRIPISRNGEHGIGNLMTLCRSCNASKKDKTIMEWKLSKIKKGVD
jgi:5-methylcytosine-specific restriction endonuclease McrA